MRASAKALLLSLFFGAFLLVLSGCSEQRGLPYALSFHERGVNTLDGSVAFEPSRIAAALPGCEAQGYSRMEGGVRHRMIIVSRGGEPLLRIYPDEQERIARIESAEEPPRVWQRDALHVRP
ncbi:MAG: hypothetical protein JXK05_13120 [Campylobacterales bacterium]|nr:hypothetical protein [Campylobacterales bacterium]